MKVSENVIVKYCDYDSTEKKVRATQVCGACSCDICDNHRNLVPVKKDNPPRWVGEERRGSAWILFEYTFVPVCPDCSSRPLTNLIATFKQDRVSGRTRFGS